MKGEKSIMNVNDIVALDIITENKYSNYLYKIFRNTNVRHYYWDVITDGTIINRENMEQNIFTKDVLSGDEFLDCIKHKDYYLIFVDLKAYSRKDDIREITTFSEFLESNCKIIFLCVDTVECTVICKDIQTLEIIYNNCLEDAFISVEKKSVMDMQNREMYAF